MFYENEEILGVSEEIGWKTKKIYPKLQDALVGDFLYENTEDKNHTDDKNSFIFQQDDAEQNPPQQYSHEAEVIRGRLVPREKIFAKILPEKNYQLQLHDQIKIGDLSFELTRFNVGMGENIGHRQTMEDGLIVE